LGRWWRLRISLFGVGYVGSVSAACLVRDGHEVIAVDINPEKIDALNRGRAPIVEPGLDALIEAGVGGGRLRGSMNAAEAVRSSEISIVCVGTPSAPDGSLDLSAVKRVATVIGGALAHKSGFHVVAVRSTLAIGTMMRLIAPLMERVSGRTAGTDFGLAYYPEFLREGSAIRDYDEPSQSVIAVTDPETFARLLAIPSHAAPPPIVLSFEEAEAIKSAHNAWHALKVSFANEMGGLLSAEGVDSHRVMETFCRDQRLNLSPAYLIPGFAFGGSCLPKDVRALRALGRRTGRPTPLLQAALDANEAVIARALALVRPRPKRRVSIIGLAFKPGVDDLRESPYLTLAERLIAQGCDVRLFDPGLHLDRLAGANLAYAMERLPDLATHFCPTLEAAIQHGETLVLAHADIGAAALDLASTNQRIVDLVRVRPGLRTSGRYFGLFW
jgi:GDP-mannose 6-dehydrogenase